MPVMYISHSVMEGQRPNNPLNPRCFCLQRPKRDGTITHVIEEVAKALGGSFKLKVKKIKRKWIYIAPLLKYITLKALRYGSHSVTYKLHRTCLYLVPDGASQTEVADI